MKKIIFFLILSLLILNTIYLLRGFVVFPYPSGDGLARWMYLGKLIRAGDFRAVDDYPLLVPILYSLVGELAFFLPYLILICLIFYVARKHLFSPLLTIIFALPLLTLPLFEQMSGRGMVGYADHFLSVFIAASLIFFENKKYLPAILFTLLAAHTKNEGQLFSLLIFIFYFWRTPLICLIPLNLILWRGYLYTQNLTWFYLLLPSAPLNLITALARIPLLFSINMTSLFNPNLFSFAGPTLIFVFLSQRRLSRPQLIVGLLAFFYLLTFILTPTSLELKSHYLVAVDRLWLHLIIPFYLLTIPSYIMRLCKSQA